MSNEVLAEEKNKYVSISLYLGLITKGIKSISGHF